MTTELSEYYYARLDAREREAYVALLNGLRLRERAILCPELADPRRVVSAVSLDRPELFFVNWVESYRIWRAEGYSALSVSYLYDRNESVALEERIGEYARGIAGISVYGKVRTLYERLAQDLAYDDAGLKAVIRSPAMFSAVGPLLYKRAVCEGVSKFASAVLKRLKVDVAVSVGRHEGVPHAWNMYRHEDGRLAYTDFTFGIGVRDTACPYAYFDLSYEEMARDHVFEDLPK